jgi:hypothetical protein
MWKNNFRKNTILFSLITLSLILLSVGAGAQEEHMTAKLCSLHPKPIIEVALNGKPAYFLLDTGSDINVVNIKGAKKYNFGTMSRKNRQHFVSTANGLLSDYMHVYNMNMTLDGIKLEGGFVSMDLGGIADSIRQKCGITIDGVLVRER